MEAHRHGVGEWRGDGELDRDHDVRIARRICPEQRVILPWSRAGYWRNQPGTGDPGRPDGYRSGVPAWLGGNVFHHAATGHGGVADLFNMFPHARRIASDDRAHV